MISDLQFFGATDLNIEVRRKPRVLLDEDAPRLDLIAHERREDLIRDRGVLVRHLEQGPALRIHRRLEQLPSVHLAKTLVALYLDVGFPVPVSAAETLDVVVALLQVEGVELFLPLRDTEQGWLRDVDVPRLDQLRHLTEEEREQQRTDVRAVHVGVRHDDDLVVPRLVELELLLDARAERGDDRPDLLVREDLVDARLLDVDDLAAQRKDRLELALAPLLRRTAGGVAFDQVGLAEGRIGE